MFVDNLGLRKSSGRVLEDERQRDLGDWVIVDHLSVGAG